MQSGTPSQTGGVPNPLAKRRHRASSYGMLFRTKFVAVFICLAAIAIGTATLLIVSAQRSEVNQTRANLAHESLSGYFQLSGAVFRTFKQARRDLLSGSGGFAFDFDAAAADIQRTLADIETVSLAEEALAGPMTQQETAAVLQALKVDVTWALDSIQTASALILSGRVAEGRANAVAVLEGQVDLRIATLIEEGISLERQHLLDAQADIRDFHTWTQRLAWAAVIVAVLVSIAILLTLVRRLSFGLQTLETGAKAYAADRMTHVIDLPGNDELSDVADRFNDMAAQIRTKRAAVEQAQRDLEARVAARTAELSEANDALRERDRLRRQFFADIGHELRTPVTAIRGEAEVALRNRNDFASAGRAALETIVSLTEQLTSNVGDLFLIAREQAGVLDLTTAPLDLNASAALAIEQMQSLTDGQAATISADLWPEGITVQGDTARMTQLVRLLISNALTHGPRDVAISLATRLDGAEAVLDVADNGPGIPEGDRARIFDRYVKLDRTAEHAASGTGLGLAIAKSIVQAHGGRIEVVESITGGACLRARFPVAARAAA